LLIGGCVRPDAPGVAIKPLKADIVFGVKEPAPAMPAAFEPPARESDLVAVLELPPQASPFTNEAPVRQRVPFIKPLDPCPEAKLNAFPAVEASRSVTNRPAPGTYKWKQSGTLVTTDPKTGQKSNTAITGLQQRVVTNVSAITATPNPLASDVQDPNQYTKTFTFDVIQPASPGFLKTTYQVRTAPIGVRSSPGVEVPIVSIPKPPAPAPAPPTTQKPPDLPDQVAAGDPERGVTIKAITKIDPNGTEHKSTFSPAVQVLPLDVIPTELFKSVGVDSATQATLVHEGQVRNRNRVDACGEIVDGWEIAIDATFVDGDVTAKAKQVFFVATQYGAMPILESTNLGEGGNVTYSLGQLAPEPLAP
jgi:hypothetical protein